MQGLLFGASEDGSSVYLVAQGVLADNENGNGERAKPAPTTCMSCTKRRRQLDTTFIADALQRRQPRVGRQQARRTPRILTARVSPDGRYLAFMSGREPDGI